MILLRFLFLATVLLTSTRTPAAPEPAVPTAATPAKKPEKSQWVFSILPKSLQKNPPIDLTVITEMTDLGKKQPVPSPKAPVYYISQSSGFHQMGHAAGNERSLKPEDVERLLGRALATNGFLPAQLPEHPPTLAVFYTWGSHNMLVEGDAENPSLSGEQVTRNLLDRAALVGGVKFSQEMLKLFQQADAMAVLNRVPPADPSGAVPPIDPILGAAQMEFLNPVNRFRQADPKNDFLVDQFTNDVYFVVASALSHTQ